MLIILQQSCGIALWGDFDDSDPEALQKLKSELHHIPGIAATSHHEQKAFTRVYMNPTVTADEGAGPYARHPDGTAQGTSNRATSGTSRYIPSMPHSLGTTALHQTGSSQPAKVPSSLSNTAIGNMTEVTFDPPLLIPRPSQFFEVCVNTGNYEVRLQEINLSWVMSDSDLFQLIWGRYSHSRGYRIRRIFLKPRDVNFVMVSS